MARLFAIGDIHGCLPALDALLGVIQPAGDDTIVTLGDYVDRGPDSRGVIERLIDLSGRCRLIPLLGNHDQMMLEIYDGRVELFIEWLLYGGDATMQSYEASRLDELPSEHIEFLRGCRLYHETERHFFLHGNYLADVPLAEQPRDTVLWESLKARLPGPHYSGKTAILGHTAQRSGEIYDLGYLKCIDTWCYGEGRLTAFEVAANQCFQADKFGRLGNAVA